MTVRKPISPNAPDTGAEQRLLQQVLGVRIESDGTLHVPLRRTWKAFSRLEFVPLGIMGSLGGYSLSLSPQGQLHFAVFLAAACILYLGVVLTLSTHRKLKWQSSSGTASLYQGQLEYKPTITGAVLGSSKRKRQPYILLDGVQYPLLSKPLIGIRARVAALQSLRERLVFGASSDEVSRRRPSAFLALLDVYSVEGSVVRFRAIWSGLSMALFMVLFVFTVLLQGMVFLECTESTPDNPYLRGGLLFLILLMCAGVAVILQKIKPTVAITAGKWAEVVEHGATYKCPSWQAQFVVSRPDPTEDGGPAFPYIELKYGKRSLTVHSSRMYDAEELEAFAERMNHYLWGGPSQPQDPANAGVAKDGVPPLCQRG